MKTKYEEYFEKQMENPEFRAYYILAKEKAKLEMMLEQFKESIPENPKRTAILRGVNKIKKHVAGINL